MGTTWQLQLSGTLKTTSPAAVYDVDGDATTAEQVAALHAAGKTVICYIDAGSYENYRRDAASFPASVLGKTLEGWPDEKWLDIRQRSILLPIMAKRIDSCRAKGFDAIDADNVDGYSNATGFRLTAQDQIAYNRALTQLAHTRGMPIGLKNTLGLIPALVDSYDFAVIEQCFEYNECELTLPFIRSGKPVFEVEYQLQPAQFCSQARAMKLSAIYSTLALDGKSTLC